MNARPPKVSGLFRCHSCRKTGNPAWVSKGGGPWQPIGHCCRESTSEVANADVAQWLRTRAIRVAWLVNARRNIPGLTVEKGAA